MGLFLYIATYLLVQSLCCGSTGQNRIGFATADNSQLEEQLYKVLRAINNALVYLQSVSNRINLDGVFGTRFVQTRIEAYMDRYAERMPMQLKHILSNIHALSRDVGDQGEAAVARNTPYYYAAVGFLMNPSVEQEYFPIRPLNPSETWKADLKLDNWEEQDCDVCMRQIGNGDAYSHCAITEKCWKNATETKMSGYSLAHQVIYLLVGINNHCVGKMNARADRSDSRTTVGELIERLCGRIASEITEIELANYTLELRDLFMEQVGVCGYAGFLSVCKPEYLQKILSWQAPSGCFHKFYGERIAPENFDPNRYGQYRRKRAEQLLSPGPEACLSHRTSVALCALSSFMTLYIESLYGDVDSPIDIQR